MRRAFFEAQFEQAAVDYYCLLNKGYPEKRTRLLISDRYQLNKAQRTVLYRGIFSRTVNQQRSGKQIVPKEVKDRSLSIDFLNLIYLLMNYLYGRNLFIATDCLLRDDGENYSRFSSTSIFSHVLTLISRSLSELQPSEVEIVLDHPHTALPFEALENTEYLEKFFCAEHTTVVVNFSSTADTDLKKNKHSIIASADSHIIDSREKGIFDLGHFILNHYYRAEFPNLAQLIGHNENNELHFLTEHTSFSTEAGL